MKPFFFRWAAEKSNPGAMPLAAAKAKPFRFMTPATMALLVALTLHGPTKAEPPAAQQAPSHPKTEVAILQVYSDYI